MAALLGVRDKQRVCATPNPTLESYFCSTSKHPTQVSIVPTSSFTFECALIIETRDNDDTLN